MVGCNDERKSRCTCSIILSCAALFLCSTFGQRLRVLSVPDGALVMLNKTSFGCVLVSGGAVYGRTAVFGSPSYGDIRSGSLVLVQFTIGTCGLSSVAGVPLMAWALNQDSWLAVVRTSEAAASCGSLLALAILLQTLPRPPNAILLLGDSVIDSETEALSTWWPVELPELPPGYIGGGNLAYVSLPSLWLRGANGAELAAFFQSNPNEARGIEAEVSWGGGTFGISYGTEPTSEEDASLSPDSSVADISSGNIVVLKAVASLTIEIEVWANLLDTSARSEAERLADALRPLRSVVRLYARQSLELQVAAEVVVEGSCISAAFVQSFPADAFGLLAQHGVASLDALRVCSPQTAGLTPGAIGAEWSPAAALEEGMRLRCLQQWVAEQTVAAGSSLELKERGGWEAALWEHFKRVVGHCPGAAAELELCSFGAMALLGLDSVAVRACSRSNQTQSRFLEEALSTPRPGKGGLEIRIGGWRYTGSRDPAGFIAAVCAALAFAWPPSGIPPAACGAAWLWLPPPWFAARIVFWPVGAAAVVSAAMVPIALPLASRVAWNVCRNLCYRSSTRINREVASSRKWSQQTSSGPTSFAGAPAVTLGVRRLNRPKIAATSSNKV